MEYSVNLVNVDRELAGWHYKASVGYTFKISNGLANTHGDVVLTDGGVDIIEQRAKTRRQPQESPWRGYSNKGGTPLRLRFCSEFRTDMRSISLRMGTTKHYPR